MKMKLASLLIFLMAFSQTPVLAVGVGHENSFLGRDAGASNLEGDSNSFFGSRAGYSNIQGNSNSFFGRGRTYPIWGIITVFLGVVLVTPIPWGIVTVFLGGVLVYTIPRGIITVFLGVVLVISISRGIITYFLGHHAGYYETGSNKLYISISDTSTPLIYGEFDNQYLLINSSVRVQEKIAIGITDTVPSYRAFRWCILRRYKLGKCFQQGSKGRYK